MEFAIYAFAALGVLALIGLLAAFVATVWTHDTQIDRLQKDLKHIEHYYDGRMDRLFDRINELEGRTSEIDEILTESILTTISPVKPKSSNKRK